MGERSPDTLVVTEANRDAAHLLTQWRSWPNGRALADGRRRAPARRTSLWLGRWKRAPASSRADTAPATTAAALFREAEGRLVIDDADGPRDEGMLWRLLDLARDPGRSGAAWGHEPPGALARPDHPGSRLTAEIFGQCPPPRARSGAYGGGFAPRICREQFIYLSDDAAQYLALAGCRALSKPRTISMAAALDAELVKGAKPVAVESGEARRLKKSRPRWVVGDG